MEMPTKRVSLQTIASALGVSVKTVSGAISKDPEIRMSAEMRHKILTMAHELGYTATAKQRPARKRAKTTIGIITDSWNTTSAATEMLQSLDQTLRLEGAQAIIISANDPASVDQAVAELQRSLPFKIVYASAQHQIISLNDFARNHLSLTVNCREVQGTIPSIIPAEFDAAVSIVDHLFEHNRNRIAFLNLPGLVPSYLREAGFRAAYRQHGRQMADAWIRSATYGAVHSDQAKSSVEAHIAELMADPLPPDAILCGNDCVALEVYNALRRLGKVVPIDIAVASFDSHIELANRFDPPMTTITMPYSSMGRLAAEMLLDRRQWAQNIEEIPFQLSTRRSV